MPTKQHGQQIGFHPWFPVVTPNTKKCRKTRKLLPTIALCIRRVISIIQKQDVLHRCVQDYWCRESYSSRSGVWYFGRNMLFAVSDVQKQDKEKCKCSKTDWFSSLISCGNSQHKKSAKKLKTYYPQKKESKFYTEVGRYNLSVCRITDAGNLVLTYNA